MEYSNYFAIPEDWGACMGRGVWARGVDAEFEAEEKECLQFHEGPCMPHKEL